MEHNSINYNFWILQIVFSSCSIAMKMLIRDCCISKCVMINKIAPLGKVASSSEVKIMEKINAELIFALNFAQNLT